MGAAGTVDVHPTGAPWFDGLLGVDGVHNSLASFAHMPILALVVTGNACPTAKAWDRELVRLQKDYLQAGLQLVLVNSNNPYLSPADTYERMVKRAAEAGFNFPYVKDAGAVLAKRLGAVCTPQVFVYDAGRRLRYTGRIADSRRPNAVVRYDMKEAIEQLALGKEVSVPRTQPFGCSLVL